VFRNRNYTLWVLCMKMKPAAGRAAMQRTILVRNMWAVCDTPQLLSREEELLDAKFFG